MFTALATSLFMALQPVHQVKDTISGSVVTSSVKRTTSITGVTAITSLTMRNMEERGISSPKDLSSVIPGLNMPDYGTSMTSTIYVRGLGSRMDNPVIGLYVDDVPVLDKNCYDFSFSDIRRLDFLHGPQGTLYGRNSMLGVLSIETLSPDAYQGTRGSIEYGSASTFSAKLSTYKGRFGLAAAMLLTMSCSKEKGDVGNPSFSDYHEYYGPMTVTAGGVDNVSEDVKVEVRIDEKAQTLDIMFNKVKFVPQMPISLDVSVPGVGFEVKDGTLEFSADGIIPLSGGTLPFPKYTVTGLAGTLTGSGISMKLNFGKYPVAYAGRKVSSNP